MKKLKTFAVSMIVAALGLLIYCGNFYIRSYKQNLAAKQGYDEITDIAVMSDKENKKPNVKKDESQDVSDTHDKSTDEKKKRKKKKTVIKQIRSGNPSGFPGKI